jgi:hypothetical protein
MSDDKRGEAVEVSKQQDQADLASLVLGMEKIIELLPGGQVVWLADDTWEGDRLEAALLATFGRKHAEALLFRSDSCGYKSHKGWVESWQFEWDSYMCQSPDVGLILRDALGEISWSAVAWVAQQDDWQTAGKFEVCRDAT